VQAKIHAELDAFLQETSKTLPSPSDRGQLPYLEAAWKESMRWMPTLVLGKGVLTKRTHADGYPAGVPHSALQDDIYKYWYIPKDTLVILNAGYVIVGHSQLYA